MKKHNTKTIVKSNANNFSRINPLVAGLDIGARSIHVCIGFADGSQMIREFPTFTRDLKEMVAWIKNNKNVSAAMESTGIYWITAFDMLAQAGIEPILVNAHYLKTVPGKKTDIKDCQWIQQLHSYGLLSGSFRPNNAGVEFRTLVRQRSRLSESASVQIQLMHKALTLMNIQINHVISDITGATGMKIIRAIVSGETDTTKLAKYRDSRYKKSEAEIAKSLEGNLRLELIFALKQALDGYDFFRNQIYECEIEIKKNLEQWNQKQENSIFSDQSDNTKNVNTLNTLDRVKKENKKSAYHFSAEDMLKSSIGVDLTKIPGINSSTAIKIVSEIGTDMSHWPSEKHFASWLGLCPGNKISGGKILSSKTKPTANKASQALRLSASTLYNSKSYLGAFFRRMRARFGAPMAITALAHKLAKIIYRMIKDFQSYRDTGQEKYEQQYKDRSVKNLKKRAKEMGFELVEKNNTVIA